MAVKGNFRYSFNIFFVDFIKIKADRYCEFITLYMIGYCLILNGCSFKVDVSMKKVNTLDWMVIGWCTQVGVGLKTSLDE